MIKKQLEILEEMEEQELATMEMFIFQVIDSCGRLERELKPITKVGAKAQSPAGKRSESAK